MYVLVVLTEADVVHVVGGRVADDVCQGSARVEERIYLCRLVN